jgi:hypothetical protein
MFWDIIHRPVYFSKHSVSDTGFCLRLQVKPTKFGPIDVLVPQGVLLLSSDDFYRDTSLVQGLIRVEVLII